MGLFSSFRRRLQRAAESAVSSVTQFAQEALPIAAQFVPGIGGVAAGLLGPALGPPSAAGGSAAVVQANLAMAGSCPPPGLRGQRSPAANPITRAAISPGFDVNRLPSRPAFGLQQTIRAQFPEPTFLQGLERFAGLQFGAPVRPTFRPFVPSFRSGRPQAPITAPQDFGAQFGPQIGVDAAVPTNLEALRQQGFGPVLTPFDQIGRPVDIGQFGRLGFSGFGF